MQTLFFRFNALLTRVYPFIARRFRVIGIGVGALVLLLLYGTIVGPKISQIQDQGLLDLERTRNELAAQQEFLEQVQTLEQRYRAIPSEDIVQLSTVLPDDAGIPELFVETQQLFSRAGFTLSQVSFSFAGSDTSTRSTTRRIVAEGVEQAAEDDALPSDVRVLKINASVKGPPGYDSFKRLLRTIEENQRITNLVSFVYQEESDQYNLSLETFYREGATTPTDSSPE